jgi:hypothetical protein
VGHPLAQRRQGHPRLLGQLRTKQSLDAGQTALAAASMGLWRTTGGGTPVLPELLNKGAAHRNPFGNFRLTLLVCLQRLDGTLA